MLDFIVTYITKMITGLDNTCLKIWEFKTWVYTYHDVELVTKLVMFMSVITIVAVMIYKIGCKFIDEEEEA